MKKTVEAAVAVAEPEADLVKELPAEDLELTDPEADLPADTKADPAGTKVDLAQQIAEAFRAPTVGVNGLPLKPEHVKLFYDRLELTDEMIRLGSLAGLDSRSLWSRAQEFRAVHPDSWRELLAGDITARASGDVSTIPWLEKLQRGIVKNPARQLEKLEERFQVALEEWNPLECVVVMQGIVETLELQTQIHVLKKGMVKDLEAELKSRKGKK